MAIYEFNHTKSGAATYGETEPDRFEEMKEREWILEDGTVDKLYEYKNLGAYMTVSSRGMQDHLGAKSTNWMAN